MSGEGEVAVGMLVERVGVCGAEEGQWSSWGGR